jgi:hypothetical protein
MMTAGIDCHENRHPQHVMTALGITYQHATPQSIADQWWFWNCENVPANLPAYLSPLKVKPHDAIGNGLSKELADAIAQGSAAGAVSEGQAMPDGHEVKQAG